MKRTEWLYWGVALIFAAILGYVNIHSIEVQSPVLVALVSSAIMGFVHPKRAWLWAIVIGLAVPLSYALAPILGYSVPYPPSPNIFATAIVFIPSFLGAYAGVLLRRLTSGERKQISS